MKNILIIGSEGFIGKACSAYFRSYANVTTADVKEGDSADNHFRPKDNDDFSELFTRGKFHACINASGSSGVAFSLSDPERDRELNVLVVKRLLEALRKYQPGCRFLNFSSAAVYGNPNSLPVSEDAGTAPLSPYGLHKLEAEGLLREYHDKYGLQTMSLRVFSAYGPGLKKQIFWDLYQMWKKTRNVELGGNGMESRDFIYIHDLVHAVELVLSKADFNGRVLNVAGGMEITINEASRIFLNYLDNGALLKFSGIRREGDPVNWRADITALRALGFEPATGIQTGLKKYTDWVREKG